MNDPFLSHHESLKIHPAQQIRGVIAGLYKAEGRGFKTVETDQLPFTFDGIPGDAHAGPTRKAGPREPWHERGTVMRNERQLSLLSVEELRAIARGLDIPELKPEWIGGNLVLDGIPNLTLLPPRTLLLFDGGVTIKVDGDNHPCRVSGRAIAAQFEGRDDIELEFKKKAEQRRGLVAWVEIPGTIKKDEGFVARIPKQWIYEVE